jgi:tetratricopeptide (TPR) repeat protein
MVRQGQPGAALSRVCKGWCCVSAHLAFGRLVLFWLSLFGLSLVVTPASAQQDDGRIALVIGNANYPDAATPLPNPIKDATAIAEEFRRMHFSVDLKTNLGKDEMRRAIDAFIGKIKNGTTALFYFSGFGLQVLHQSYLVPVDAQIWNEADVRRDGFGIDAVLAAMHRKGAKAKIVIIDAARRNPFERRFRNVAAGLAPLNAPASTLVLYSVGLNRLFTDKRFGNNSLFAVELIKELRSASLPVEEMFKRVRISVSRASNNEQIPWVASSMLGDIYFGSTQSSTQAPVAHNTPPFSAAPSASTTPPESSEAAKLAYYNRGLAFYEKKDYDHAITEFNEAIRLDPNFSDAYNNRGHIYERKKQYDRAIADFNEAIRLDQNNAMAYNNRGDIYSHKKQYDSAIADFTESIRLDPNIALAYSNRGEIYFNKKQYDRAIADFTEAIRLDPDNALAYNNRGYVYGNKGQYDRAVADLSEAIRLDPNLALAYNNRGENYFNKKQYDSAIADFTEAIRIDPDLAVAYSNLGEIHYRKKLYDRAIADFTGAIRIDPNNALAYNNRGYIYARKGQYDRAVADLSEAIRLDPNLALAYNNRGHIYERKKQYKRAIADFTDAIRLDPSDADAKEALKRARRAR